MENILTPIQVEYLQIELEQTKQKLEKAKQYMSDYKETEQNKTGGELDYTVLDNSYYEEIASLVIRISEIEDLLGNYILANPKGKIVQIGSVVTLADSELKFMVVQNRVTSTSIIKEVSIETPIFGAIYMHKVGDICEYTVNGKSRKCVIEDIDNDYCNTVLQTMDGNESNHSLIR